MSFYGCDELTSLSAKKGPEESELMVLSTKDYLVNWWAVSHNKVFDQQILLWRDIVEPTHTRLHNEFSWQENLIRNDEIDQNHRDLKLREGLSFYVDAYQNHRDRIVQIYQIVESSLPDQFEKIKAFLPETKFKVKVFVFPSNNFNGRVETGTDPSKVPYVAFSPEMIAVLEEKGFPNNVRILVAHEFFHVFHAYKSKLLYVKDNSIVDLWGEGLAQLASQIIEPEATRAEVLMSNELIKIDSKKVRKYAKELLRDLGGQSLDYKEQYSKWMSFYWSDPKKQPSRLGYLIAYEAAKFLHSDHSMDEMIGWDLKKVEDKFIPAIEGIANGSAPLVMH